jgi:hypothetical protein
MRTVRRRFACALGLVACMAPVWAQTISVITPKLPPRGNASGAGQGAGHGAGQYAGQGTAGAQPGAVPQPGAYGGGGQGAGHQPYQGQQYQGQQYQGQQYQGQPGQAQPYPNQQYQPQPAFAAVTPQRAPAGACRAQVTPERQTVMLVSGADALARGHVPLGEYRAQQIVHSPDGRWAVVYTKLRGVAQFAALTIDLERCEMQRTIELKAAGEDVRFDGDDAVLRLTSGEQRIGLRDGRVR